jgi:hypothetical protein
MADFEPGDRVKWNTPQGETHGEVVEKVTSRTHVEGQELAASEDDPRYIVESDKSGERAGHRADAPGHDRLPPQPRRGIQARLQGMRGLPAGPHRRFPLHADPLAPACVPPQCGPDPYPLAPARQHRTVRLAP